MTSWVPYCLALWWEPWKMLGANLHIIWIYIWIDRFTYESVSHYGFCFIKRSRLELPAQSHWLPPGEWYPPVSPHLPPMFPHPKNRSWISHSHGFLSPLGLHKFLFHSDFKHPFFHIFWSPLFKGYQRLLVLCLISIIFPRPRFWPWNRKLWSISAVLIRALILSRGCALEGERYTNYAVYVWSEISCISCVTRWNMLSEESFVFLDSKILVKQFPTYGPAFLRILIHC